MSTRARTIVLLVAIATAAASTACSFLFSFDGYAAAGDAAPDAGDAGFCASLTPAPAFCADFDEEAGPAWDGISIFPDAASIAIDSTRSSSPPRSLLSSVPGTNGYPWAFATKKLGDSAASVTLDADMWIERVDVDASNGTRILGFANAQMELELNVFASGATQVFYEGTGSDGGPDYAVGPSFTLPVSSAPFHITMHLTFDTSTLDVTVGTTKVVDAFVVPRTISPASPRIQVGLYYPQTTTTGWQVRYDNVVAVVN